jgi:site-specific DNA-methyltransferase (adenine-specific)
MQIGKATILHIDCMEYLATLPDKAFELAIVDPPYGIGMDGNNNWSGSKHEKKAWDNKPPSEDYFSELFRVSKNQIIWGANHFIDKIKTGSPCWLVWDKKNDGFSFADGELAWTSFHKAVRFFRFARGEQTDNRIHPTQKPTRLYEWILANYAKPGDKILDTHLGSGSSAIACNSLDFEMVGCELDKDYYDQACKRIEHHTKQMRLFA